MAISEKMQDRLEMLVAAVLLGATVTTSAYAQRPPEYQAARTQGLVGELPTGYLGFVTPPSASIKALVDDLNIKRKADYTKAALENGVTVEEFAFRNACRLISGKTTAVGEKYMAPDRTWKTKDENPPYLDSRCPPG
jgi:uncharacterized protein